MPRLKQVSTFSAVKSNAVLLLARTYTAIHMAVLSRSYLSNKNEFYTQLNGVFVYVIYLCHSFEQFPTLYLPISAAENMSRIDLCGTVDTVFDLIDARGTYVDLFSTTSAKRSSSGR